MSFLRARQRVITAISPHQGNRQFLIPSRYQRKALLQNLTAAWNFRGGTLTDSVSGLTLDFARASEASYFDKQRVMQTAANDVARFDHDPGDGSVLGLLIEEQRENLCLQNESFDLAPWVDVEASVTANATTAPDGSNNADKLVESALAANQHRIDQPFVNAAGDFVWYVYAKAAERTQINMRIDSEGGNNYFNLITGEIVGDQANGQEMQRLANGWWRCSMVLAAASANSTGRINLVLDNSIGYDGDGVSGAYLWRGQFEEGLFPTSSIKTGAASGTREADDCGTSDLTWLTEGIGTIYAESSLLDVTAVDSYIYELNNGGTNFRIAGGVRMAGSANGVYAFWGRDLGATQFFITWNGTGNNQFFKTAGAYQADDVASYYNGSPGTPDTVAVIPQPMTEFVVGSRFNQLSYLNGHIAVLGYIPERLPNNILRSITL